MNSEPIVQERTRPKGERRRSSWSMLAVVLVVLAALVVVPFLVLRPRADIYTLRSYQTAPVQSGTLVEYVRGSGRLVPRLERSLLAPGKGTLTDWQVAVGESVQEGQVLGHLASTEIEGEVAGARSALSSAQRELEELDIAAEVSTREAARKLEALRAASEEAQQKLETTQALFEVGAVSAQELQNAQDAAGQAEADVSDARADRQAERRTEALAKANAQAALEEAQAALERAESRAASLELKAPIEGLLIALGAEVGEAVQAGQVLTTVASSTDLRVEADLSEAQARRASVGQRAQVGVAGQDYAATVVQVSPQTEAGAEGAVVPITLDFTEPPVGLRVGASATVEIEVGRKEDALYLPRGPYLTTGGERLAYVVTGERAIRRTVVFGLIDGNRVEVRDGLTEGQKVIVSSYEAFKDQEEIRLSPEGEIE